MGVRPLRPVRQALRRVAPAWLNVPVDRQLWPNLRTALQPPPVPEDLALLRRPHGRRIIAVYAVLDRAWAQQGAATYDQLLSAVEEATGQRCSRKLIAKWKRVRGWR